MRFRHFSPDEPVPIPTSCGVRLLLEGQELISHEELLDMLATEFERWEIAFSTANNLWASSEPDGMGGSDTGGYRYETQEDAVLHRLLDIISRERFRANSAERKIV